VQRLLEKGELLWLDLYRPDADELGMLATVFGIHHLAIDDAASSGSARSCWTTTTSPS
jgi:Mg2+ and Co2+ transporter CorA